MKSVEELFDAVGKHFPDLAERTEENHVQRFDMPGSELPYLWFGTLADTLNQEMMKGTPYDRHAPFFDFISNVLVGSNRKIHDCIDVALVENLFWDVAVDQAKPYWQNLPPSLKKLYLGFHNRPPA